MKLTELGKELRKIRLDRHEVLFDMAGKIGISTAMLSAVETGSKPAPEAFVSRLASCYEEIAQEQERFEELADLTKTQVKLKLEGDEKTTTLMVAFARSVNELNNADIEAMLEVLAKYRPKGNHVDASKKQDRNM